MLNDEKEFLKRDVIVFLMFCEYWYLGGYEN